jgi:hypothetical protein
MVFLTKARRATLAAQASVSRRERTNRLAAVILVVLYNVVGALDILSTHWSVTAGVAEEINPIMRAGMDHLGYGWIVAKLFLQGIICGMVLWFPHRFVLSFFALAIAFNAGVVYNNFSIFYGW